MDPYNMMLDQCLMLEQHGILDAINAVLAWDIPDESLAEAFCSQAGLMAGYMSE